MRQSSIALKGVRKIDAGEFGVPVLFEEGVAFADKRFCACASGVAPGRYPCAPGNVLARFEVDELFWHAAEEIPGALPEDEIGVFWGGRHRCAVVHALKRRAATMLKS